MERERASYKKYKNGCPRSELKYLHNMKPNLTKILEIKTKIKTNIKNFNFF